MTRRPEPAQPRHTDFGRLARRKGHPGPSKRRVTGTKWARNVGRTRGLRPRHLGSGGGARAAQDLVPCAGPTAGITVKTTTPAPAEVEEPSMNQQSTPAGSIAVGVDGSACAGLALDWATEEASRRKLALHIVHAFSYQYPMTSAGMGFVIEGVRGIAEELCERAVAHVNTTHPELTVTWDVSTYGAAPALVDASRVRPHRRGRRPRGRRDPRGTAGLGLDPGGVARALPRGRHPREPAQPQGGRPGGRRRGRLGALDERDRLRLRRGCDAKGRPDRGPRLVAGLRRGRVRLGHLDRGLGEPGPARRTRWSPSRSPDGRRSTPTSRSRGRARTTTRSTPWCARARTRASSSSGHADVAASAGCCWAR